MLWPGGFAADISNMCKRGELVEPARTSFVLWCFALEHRSCSRVAALIAGAPICNLSCTHDCHCYLHDCGVEAGARHHVKLVVKACLSKLLRTSWWHSRMLSVAPYVCVHRHCTIFTQRAWACCGHVLIFHLALRGDREAANVLCRKHSVRCTRHMGCKRCQRYSVRYNGCWVEWVGRPTPWVRIYHSNVACW